ncbi:MAG: toll/interleukin-1 receptor domain-containing protein [Phototrophicaceae bacterium]
MGRIFLVAISVIIAFIAFSFLWFANPLYAFVGAVVVIVFMMIGLALIFNRPTKASAPEPKPLYEPSRRGEVRQLPPEEKPEGHWDDETLADGDLSPPRQQNFGGLVPEPVSVSKPDKKEERSNQPQPPPAPIISRPTAPIVKQSESEEMLLIEEGEDEETVIPDLLDESESQPTSQQSVDIDRELTVSDQKQSSLSETQFSAYYPRRAAANTEYGFYVYAHLPNALIDIDIQQFETELGGRIPKVKVADESAQVEANSMLTSMIHCDDLQFNQMGVMQQWQPPFVRFDFRFTAKEALVDEIVTGRVAILMGVIEIASIDFQIMIAPVTSMAIVNAVPNDPRTAYNYDASDPASLYQKIFISYSRKDTVIAEQYRMIQTMAGNIIFMDTHSIRAGENWEVALKRFIDDADVFQLFWSEHSAQSEHVKFEWDYALQQRCPETRCVQFIRPAYWQKPLADIPAPLSHLHFAFVDLSKASEQ